MWGLRELAAAAGRGAQGAHAHCRHWHLVGHGSSQCCALVEGGGGWRGVQPAWQLLLQGFSMAWLQLLHSHQGSPKLDSMRKQGTGLPNSWKSLRICATRGGEGSRVHFPRCQCCRHTVWHRAAGQAVLLTPACSAGQSPTPLGTSTLSFPSVAAAASGGCAPCGGVCGRSSHPSSSLTPAPSPAECHTPATPLGTVSTLHSVLLLSCNSSPLPQHQPRHFPTCCSERAGCPGSHVGSYGMVAAAAPPRNGAGQAGPYHPQG